MQHLFFYTISLGMFMTVHILKTFLCSFNIFITNFELLCLYMGEPDLNVTELVAPPPPFLLLELSLRFVICSNCWWNEKKTCQPYQLKQRSKNLPCSPGTKVLRPFATETCVDEKAPPFPLQSKGRFFSFTLLSFENISFKNS